MIKSVLVHIREDDGQRSRIETAAAVARSTEATLACVQVLPCPDLYPTHPLTSSHLMKLLHDTVVDVRVREAENRRRLERQLERAGVPVAWEEHEGETAPVLAGASRFADLVVVSLGAEGDSRTQPLPLLEEMILSSSVPVIAVPPALRRFDPSGTAILAWNGSQEAARACREAMSLLRLASRTLIVSVGDASLEASAERLRRYLRLHGIDAQLQHEDGDDPADALSRAAAAVDAAWITMGAYGRARWRETAFGGVTRAMLGSDAWPLLMVR